MPSAGFYPSCYFFYNSSNHYPSCINTGKNGKINYLYLFQSANRRCDGRLRAPAAHQPERQGVGRAEQVHSEEVLLSGRDAGARARLRLAHAGHRTLRRHCRVW